VSERALTVRDVALEQRITVRVDTFCELTGIGRTKVYKMMDDGRLDSVKLDKQRLILVESYRRLLRSLPSR
jgi:excisionase family DNA binding protein